MNHSVDDRLAAIHPRMLKAGGEGDPRTLGKLVVGRAFERALARCGLTKQEAAFALGYTDSGVVSRWTTGTESLQLARLWLLGVVFMREFVIALAEQIDGMEVVTTISAERRAS